MRARAFIENWRQVAAYVYLTICVVDFVLMPIYYEYNTKKSIETIVAMSKKFDGADQVEALRILQHEESWSPISLEGGGLFHIAFGAILGVSAWSRQTNGSYKNNQYGSPSNWNNNQYGEYGGYNDYPRNSQRDEYNDYRYTNHRRGVTYGDINNNTEYNPDEIK